jgi:NCAIR mutase (PurE)-related protein
MKKIKEVNCDLNRNSRCGFPEFIYGEGKTFEQIKLAICEIRKNNDPVLVTRLDRNVGKKIKKLFPDGIYDEYSRVFFIKSKKARNNPGKITIVTGGTTDLPVAYEAKYTLELCGFSPTLLPDSGVAGIHRLLENTEILQNSDIIIAVAGMEGALPSVIGGLTASPVIAVPTNVGYGSSLGGLTAMFAMLNSCANGITVVNINNGFGAACAAIRMLNRYLSNRLSKSPLLPK